eukprot:1161981-Pelagomonas_calceolata.AAC.13
MKERVPSGPQRPIPLGESTCPPLQSRSPSSSHPFPNPRPSSDQPSDLSSPETGRGVEDAGTPPQPSQLAQSPFMSAPNLSLSSKGDALLSSTSGQAMSCNSNHASEHAKLVKLPMDARSNEFIFGSGAYGGWEHLKCNGDKRAKF